MPIISNMIDRFDAIPIKMPMTFFTNWNKIFLIYMETQKTWIVKTILNKMTEESVSLTSDFHISSVQFSHSVVSKSLRPHGQQHARLLCPSLTPRTYLNSCPLSQWCHPTISSSVVPFSSRLQSFPASGSFQMSLFFTSSKALVIKIMVLAQKLIDQ